jgi:hypothetical protein
MAFSFQTVTRAAGISLGITKPQKSAISEAKRELIT